MSYKVRTDWMRKYINTSLVVNFWLTLILMSFNIVIWSYVIVYIYTLIKFCK